MENLLSYSHSSKFNTLNEQRGLSDPDKLLLRQTGMSVFWEEINYERISDIDKTGKTRGY